ncbi:hypothetical protein [Clostridium sp. YIM B02500]|uniref:hypothetical protein n=1 Tax=Clostridium sp. YIM B02500 TaxID=2910681 RepID=UPI001EEF3B62|nr:hypothetical protein [Clostridium sp. YIM B02500]
MCATPCTNRFEDKCSGCGSYSDPIFVWSSLTTVVKMLIKRGVAVKDTDIKYCTTHKTKVTIYITGSVPQYLLGELPCEWQLQCLSNEVWYLRCNELHPDKRIQELEQWLEDKN